MTPPNGPECKMKDQTNQVLRDELAGMMGWTRNPEKDQRRGGQDYECWVKGGDACWEHTEHDSFLTHPIPNNLTTAVACLPDEWRWLRWMLQGKWCWTALRQGHISSNIQDWVRDGGVTVPDTNDEIADRFALALACRKAVTPLPEQSMKKAKKKRKVIGYVRYCPGPATVSPFGVIRATRQEAESDIQCGACCAVCLTELPPKRKGKQ